MKRKFIIKLNLLIFVPALTAGLFFTCGFFFKVPAGVTVDGVDVGGLSVRSAVTAVRENTIKNLKSKKLCVNGKRRYVFAYPEINFKDNAREVVASSKKGGTYSTEVSYYLNGLDEIATYICADESCAPVEPYAVFNSYGEPFTYFEGSDGAEADREKLVSDIKDSLENGFGEVYARVNVLKRTKTMDEVRADTKLLTSFTTYFDGSNYPRSHNIRLASGKINGRIIRDGEEFSFNNTVGVRSEARGFKTAKMIENGEFVEGVGGGVCQVSTTLYNAVVRAGCSVTEYHPHSLAVGYVPPSFDAMVSGTYCDLKFKNATGATLFVRAYTGDNFVKFSVYGRGDGAKYEMMSRVTASIPAEEEITDDPSKARKGKDGTKSEAYLTVTKDGRKRTVLLRRDSYSPVKHVVCEEVGEEQNGEQSGD